MREGARGSQLEVLTATSATTKNQEVPADLWADTWVRSCISEQSQPAPTVVYMPAEVVGKKQGLRPWWQLGLLWMEDTHPFIFWLPCGRICVQEELFFKAVSSHKCFAVFKKGKIVNKASSFKIFAWLVLTPTGAAEQGLQQLGNQCPAVSQEAELIGEWTIPPLQSRSYNHEGNKRAQLTWLMCLSLSMIWLMTGSGGLLLLDSELGCSRFRPGPGYLKGREENA